MHRSTLLGLSITLAALTAAPNAASTGTAQPDRYQQLIAEYDQMIERPLRETQTALRPAYTALFGDLESSVDTLSIGNLRQLIEATELMASLDGDDHFRVLHQSAVDELVERGESQPDDLLRLHHSLVDWRDFTSAHRLRARHPDIAFKIPPEIVPRDTAKTPAGRWVYRVDDNHHRLMETPLQFGNGRHLLALIHPGCPHSRRAVTALSQDADLLAALDGKVSWLTSPDGIFHLPVFQEWNRTYPGFQIVIPVDPWDWDIVDTWGFPIFLLLEDGQVIEQWQGWPDDHSTHEGLRASFAQRIEKRLSRSICLECLPSALKGVDVKTGDGSPMAAKDMPRTLPSHLLGDVPMHRFAK